jgi:hypothetical protein
MKMKNDYVCHIFFVVKHIFKFSFFKDFKTPLLTPRVSEARTTQYEQNMDEFNRNLENLSINYSSIDMNDCMYRRY